MKAISKQAIIGADFRVPKCVPGTTNVITSFRDSLRASRKICLEVVGGVSARNASASNNHVEDIILQKTGHSCSVCGGLKD